MEYDRPIPKYGDKMTVAEFVETCKMGCFIDYDGSGHPAKGDMMSRQYICPSNLAAIPKDATHIIWFNR